jgi:hypothetical protein
MADDNGVKGLIVDPDPVIANLTVALHASGGVKAVWDIPPEKVHLGYVMVGYAHQMLLTHLLQTTPELKGGRLFRPRLGT